LPIDWADLQAQRALLSGTATTVGGFDLPDALNRLLAELAAGSGATHGTDEDGQPLWDACGEQVVESPLARLVALTGQDHGWDAAAWAVATKDCRRFP
jgi:hypothetical protein